MTKQTKIILALDERDEAMQSLKDAYEVRFGALKVNEAGETNRHDILELNAWYTQEENKINNDFIREITEKGE